MSEIEAAATDSVGSLFRRRPKHAMPVGTPCPNCSTPLQGPFCYACGQSGEDYHRSIVRLGAEALEGLFEMDGRLWRTLPKLITKPGKLTREYLDGHRAPQIPPFRMFLIVVVIVFFAGSLGAAGKHGETHIVAPKDVAGMSADMKKDMAKDGFDIDANGVNMHGTKLKARERQSAGGKWMLDRLQTISDNKAAFKAAMNDWGHRLAILALPMSACILGLLFIFRRQFVLFDHLIFSMHSLSFQGLLLSVIMIGDHFINGPLDILYLASPVHLFVHMRGVYGRGVFMTLVRMFLLFVASCVGGGLIMALVFVMSALAVKPNVPTPPQQTPATATQGADVTDKGDTKDNSGDDKPTGPAIAKPAAPKAPADTAKSELKAAIKSVIKPSSRP